MYNSNHFNKQTNLDNDLVKLTYKNNLNKEISLKLNKEQIFNRLKWYQINQRLEETINESKELINYFNDRIKSKGLINKN